MTVKANSIIRRRYFGRHFEPGVAQYQHPEENGGKPYCILIKKNAIDRMNQTFECLPIFVHHVTDVARAEDLGEQCGAVVKSFYNELDGSYWVEFIVEGQDANDKIAQGWRLSNAYRVTEDAPGGAWHAVPYLQEVMNGRFDHLAIVDKPRYESSVILTPEDYKAYTEKLKRERDLRHNSLEGDKTMKLDLTKLPFFNRSTANQDEVKKLLDLSVPIGPKKVETSIATLIQNAHDFAEAHEAAEAEASKGNYPLANMMHMCEIEEAGAKRKMNVGDLVKAYNELHKQYALAKQNDPTGDDAAALQKKKELEDGEKELETKKNELEAQKTKLAEDEAALKTREEEIKTKTNALEEKKKTVETRVNKVDDEEPVKPAIMTMEDRLALGRKLA